MNLVPPVQWGNEELPNIQAIGIQLLQADLPSIRIFLESPAAMLTTMRAALALQLVLLALHPATWACSHSQSSQKLLCYLPVVGALQLHKRTQGNAAGVTNTGTKQRGRRAG